MLTEWEIPTATHSTSYSHVHPEVQKLDPNHPVVVAFSQASKGRKGFNVLAMSLALSPAGVQPLSIYDAGDLIAPGVMEYY